MMSPVLRQGVVNRRALVWAIWAINAAITAIYTAIGISILTSLNGLLGLIPSADPMASLPRGLQAAIALGILVSVGFSVVFLLLLLWSSFGRSGAGYSYGFLVASAGQTGISMAIVGAFLTSIDGWLSNQTTYMWSANNKSQFQAVYALAFCSCIIHLVLFIILSVWEGMSPESGGQQGLFMNLKPNYLQNSNSYPQQSMASQDSMQMQSQNMQQGQQGMGGGGGNGGGGQTGPAPANPFV